MRSFTVYLSLALPALAAAASIDNVDYAAILKRQEPGSPKYECHSACGTVITMSRVDGFCKDPAFTTNLNHCLDCALREDIWKMYGGSVSRAATACGVDATPKPTGGSGSSSTPEPTPTETTATEPTASATPTTEAPTTTAPPTETSTKTDDGEETSTEQTSSSVGYPQEPSSTVTSESSYPVPSGTAPGHSHSPSGNGTVPTGTDSTPPPPEQTTNAAGRLSAAGMGIASLFVAWAVLL